MVRNHFLYSISCLVSFAPLFSLSTLPASHHNRCCCRLLPPLLSHSFSWPLPQNYISLLWLLTSKHVCLFNLMKMVPILILGSLSLNFIVGLILSILTLFLTTPLKHRLLKIPIGNVLMILFAYEFMVLLVPLFLNRLSVSMIVLLMLGLALRTTFKTTKLSVFFTLSLNSMIFP